MEIVLVLIETKMVYWLCEGFWGVMWQINPIGITPPQKSMVLMEEANGT